jgi:AcrR family transcriptional regulator
MQAAALPPLLAAALADPEPRSRLIVAMASVLEQKNFAATSVADVVRLARVSKRTFYEHFPTREACYIASYEALSSGLLGRIALAAAAEPDVERRLFATTHAYLSALEEVPELARSFFLEIQLAGPEALTARRGIHRRFADLLRLLVAQAQRERSDVRSLSQSMSIAVVGAINELLMVRLEEGRADLTPLAETMVELVEAIVLPSALVRAETQVGGTT